MPRRLHTPEEIVEILRDAEIRTGQGKTIRSICQEMRISEAVYYRWKKEYNEIAPNQAKRLKTLEKENDRLKKLLAETMLDNWILKNINQGNL